MMNSPTAVATRRRRAAVPRAFCHRAGVRVEGAQITCDTESSATDVVFLSHARALAGLGRRRRVPRAGRHEVLVTPATLTLLGRQGDRLRKVALPAGFGRPFVLGSARVELFPSGHLPGAASLLVDADGRRVVYAGTVRRDTAEIRRADALCLEGTFGSPRFTFPSVPEALAQTIAFVLDARAAGRSAVLLTPPFSTALDVAHALVQAGIVPRAHRGIADAAALSAAAGAAPAGVLRWGGGRLQPDEALLWPPEARGAAVLSGLHAPRFAYVSGFAADSDMVARVGADVGIPLSNQSGFPDLLAYAESTGAREIAVHRGFADEFVLALRARGFDAYALGPPRQLHLFGA